MRITFRRLCWLSLGSSLVCIIFIFISLSDNADRLVDDPSGQLYADGAYGYRSMLRKLKKNSQPTANSMSQEYETPQPEHDVQPDEPSQYPGPRRVDTILVASLQIYLDQYNREFGEPVDCNFTNDMLLGQFLYKKLNRKLWSDKDPWEKFYNQIGMCDMYRENSIVVEQLLQAMGTLPIKSVENMSGGTQVKLIITYENGQKALFKPMRFGRNYETHPNHFYFTDFERHNAELAAFHLDKILGFRRVPPLVGRVVDMDVELWQKAERSLAKTFFYSPAKNLCFVSKCDYYCDTTHAVCGKPDHIEGSFQVFLPDDEIVTREHIRSPFKRTYSKKTQLAVWQTDNSYCDRVVKHRASFKSGRRLLDLIDMSIFDTLMGNLDRHHYETFTVFENIVYPIHLDNGRGFGKAREDYPDCLAPLYQCCLIRPSTFKRLLSLYAGPVSITEALNKSMSRDPVAPLLADKHFVAIERRLEYILHKLRTCLDKNRNDISQVIRTTYHNPNPNIEEEEEEDES